MASIVSKVLQTAKVNGGQALCYVLLVATAYAAAVLCIGDELLPGSPAFALAFIWAAAHIGSALMQLVKLPPLIGMLLSGVVIVNLPGNLAALPDSWSARLRAGALAIILMRSGLDLDLDALRSGGGTVARLTACPGIAEAVVAGAVAMAVFKMPFMLGLTLGFILAAVSPAIVVSGMFDMQRRGYGVAKGIPSLVVAAASFDDILAITGYSLCIGLAVPSGRSLAMSIAGGPINLVAGILGGALAGCVLGCTSLFHSRALRTGGSVLIALLLMYTAFQLRYTGAGAMAAHVLSLVAAKFWAKENLPKWYNPTPSHEYAHETETDAAQLWQMVAQPMLFGVIGTAVDFKVLSPSSIPKALVVILAGVAVRIPMAVGVTWGADLNLKERLFIGGSWLAKATVQAALASAPFDLILETKKDDEDFEEWKSWGTSIITTAVFSILATAPAGLLFINHFGDKWLHQDHITLRMVPSQAAGLNELEGLSYDPDAEDADMRATAAKMSSAGAHGQHHGGDDHVPGDGDERISAVPGQGVLPQPSLPRLGSAPFPLLSSRLGSTVGSLRRRTLEPQPTMTARRQHKDPAYWEAILRGQAETLGAGEHTEQAVALFAKVLTLVSTEAETLAAEGVSDEQRVASAAALKDALTQFEQASVALSLTGAQAAIEATSGTAGNFFRFAKRTVLSSRQQSGIDGEVIPSLVQRVTERESRARAEDVPGSSSGDAKDAVAVQIP